LSRYLAVEGWPGEKSIEARLWQQADELTPRQRFADYTQAIMDLGATLCTRSRPACERCPVAQECVARKGNRVADFPFPKPKKPKPVRQASLLMLLNAQQQIWLEQRPQQGIWGGLWSLPQYESHQELLAQLEPVLQSSAKQASSLIKWRKFRHSFSHYHLDIEPIKVVQVAEVPLQRQGRWHNLTQAVELGLPAPVKRLLDQLEKEYVKNGEMRQDG
jgi:A/G-specific adenine glycosylase